MKKVLQASLDDDGDPGDDDDDDDDGATRVELHLNSGVLVP